MFNLLKKLIRKNLIIEQIDYKKIFKFVSESKKVIFNS